MTRRCSRIDTTCEVEPLSLSPTGRRQGFQPDICFSILGGKKLTESVKPEWFCYVVVYVVDGRQNFLNLT